MTAPAPTAWLGQFCLHVADLERSVSFYEAIGLTCTSRTEIPGHLEAIVENPDGGSKLQLAQRTDASGPVDIGDGIWKLYVNTRDLAATFAAALAAGAAVESEPRRMERWPVTIAFVTDPDGYLVEFVERDPWPDTSPH
jgi:catechol 2,3-dioxygenase-like lactoylglutathione lyase family enzyme